VKTTTLKKSEFKKEWHVLDATDISVGRLASRVSLILKGKNKPQFSPNLPVGDGVIIINTDKVKFTGNKNTDKKYYRHTGHPGGIKEITPDKLKENSKSEDIIKKAIKGMLPNSPLFRDLMKNNLKLYKDGVHPHESQNPKSIDFKSLNRKNAVNV
jgi:large subunit ribosomal protein L13